MKTDYPIFSLTQIKQVHKNYNTIFHTEALIPNISSIKLSPYEPVITYKHDLAELAARKAAPDFSILKPNSVSTAYLMITLSFVLYDFIREKPLTNNLFRFFYITMNLCVWLFLMAELFTVNDKDTHDIFFFLQQKRKYAKKTKIESFPAALTPERAIKYFISFLSGQWFGSNLTELAEYFASELDKRGSITSDEDKINLLLYEGILDILLIALGKFKKEDKLITALSKITTYEERIGDQYDDQLIELFKNQYYQNLVLYALHDYWVSPFSHVDKNKLIDFKHDSALSLIIAIGSSSDMATVFSNLEQLEQTLQQPDPSQAINLFYREKAYRLVNQAAFLMQEQSASCIFVNVVLQAAFCFLLAAKFVL